MRVASAMGCIRMILMSLAVLWLIVNGFSVVMKTVGHGAMSDALKRQMVTIFVIFVVMLLFKLI